MSKQHTPTGTLLNIVEICDHPSEKREQIAFVQMPELCLDISCMQSPEMDRVKFESRIKEIAHRFNNYDMLVELLYEANNQARRLLNTYDPYNTAGIKKVNSRAKYLAENFGNDDEPKIIQS